MVDGDAVDCDECVPGSLPKRACEFFDCGWVGVAVAGGWDLRKAVGGLKVKAESVVLYGLGN